MLDLIDYWLSLESSVSEDHDRNFKYAVWRACKEASKFLVGIFRERSHEVSVDGTSDEDEERGSLWERVADTELGPEDVACETDELSRARRLIQDADQGDREGWLDDLLAGLPESASAQKAGVVQSTIHRRRRNGARRFAVKACSYGLR